MKTDYLKIATNLLHPNYPQMVGDAKCRTLDSYLDANAEQSIDIEFYENLLETVEAYYKRANFTTFKYKNEYGAECQAIYDKGGRGRQVELVGIEGIETNLDPIYKMVVKCCIKKMQPVVAKVDFDTSDTTNPPIFDNQLIVDLHREFRGYIFTSIDIDNFKNYFRRTPIKIEINEGITLPELCYFFGKIEYKQVVVSKFSDWMKNHIGGNSYGKNKQEFNRIIKDVNQMNKSNFNLTVPQAKALENKDKIDKLLNPILSK